MLPDTLSNKDKSFLRLAARVAEQSCAETRHGAVIVSGGRVLAVGWNKNKNIPQVFSDGDLFCCSIHAEMDALRFLRGPDNSYAKASGATIYVTRLTKSGRIAMSKPCEACQKTLDEVGIRKVVHT